MRCRCHNCRTTGFRIGCQILDHWLSRCLCHKNWSSTFDLWSWRHILTHRNWSNVHSTSGAGATSSMTGAGVAWVTAGAGAMYSPTGAGSSCNADSVATGASNVVVAGTAENIFPQRELPSTKRLEPMKVKLLRTTHTHKKPQRRIPKPSDSESEPKYLRKRNGLPDKCDPVRTNR